jgi:hypothetical protein
MTCKKIHTRRKRARKFNNGKFYQSGRDALKLGKMPLISKTKDSSRKILNL